MQQILHKVCSVLLTLSLAVVSMHALAREVAAPKTKPVKTAHEIPIFSQNLGFYLPTGWKLAFQRLESNMYSAEYVPPEHGLRGWKSLFCVQGFQGMANTFTPDQFLDSMAATYKQTCKGDVYYKKLESISVSGNKGVTALLGCTVMPNTHRSEVLKEHNHNSKPRGEMGFYTVLGGKDDLYMLHKSVRGKVFDMQSLPVNQDTWPSFIKQMQPFSLQ